MLGNFVGKGKKIDDIDIPRIGSRINCGEDELHAFMDVEAAGSGFDRRGRPRALYEPHVAWRNSTGNVRAALVAEGLAYQRWGEQPYPSDSYDRIHRAAEISETVACLATSWGLGQILGENYAVVGYDTPQDMVLSFMDDEENHLEAIVEFLIANNIDDDLAAHRWEVVARVYNGPGYARNQYDVKMARAYAKWAKIPDTPWDGEPQVVQTPTEEKHYPFLRRGMKGDPVAELQQALKAKGHVLAIDGDFGPKTEGQVKLFQARNGLWIDGLVGKQTWGALVS